MDSELSYRKLECIFFTLKFFIISIVLRGLKAFEVKSSHHSPESSWLEVLHFTELLLGFPLLASCLGAPFCSRREAFTHTTKHFAVLQQNEECCSNQT